MMELVSEAEYFNSYIRYILSANGFAVEYNPTIYILQYVEGTAPKAQKEELEEFSAKIKAEKRLRVCGKILRHVGDSRLTSDGADKELLWVMLVNKESAAMKILSHIILDELSAKYEDMLIIEDMKNLPAPEQIDKSRKAKFFFGNIANKEWLLKKYVSKIIADNHLPDSQTLVAISAMSYEKRAVSARLYFSEKDMPSQKNANICFGQKAEDRVQIAEKSLRAVRKLMEMAGKGYGLWVKVPELWIEGIAKDGVCKTSVYITFKEYMAWSINKGKEVILGYHKGGYYIPALEPENDNEEQIKKLTSLCEINISKQKIAKIKKLVEKVSKVCQHGTSLVFMEKVALSAELDGRLVSYKKAYKMQPFPLDKMEDEALQGITAIDGAVFLDLNCKCYAVGVIVDGETVKKGNTGRGARYNSLTNYVDWYKNQQEHHGVKCFAVIFSEDGMINVEIPQLP